MNPFPGPRSVLVLDNVNSHLSEDLATMCEEAGVRLEYLPPYSPDYNPIEESFSALKAWMRRNRELVLVFEPFFEGYYPVYPLPHSSTGEQALLIKRGEYLAKMGDCIACHTDVKAKKPAYAGGLALDTPFGVIYIVLRSPRYM